MKVSDNQNCFICGTDNQIGLKIKPIRDPGKGTAWMTVVVPERFQGWEGVVHGGLIAALLDEVSAYAAMTVSTQIVTAELNVRYLKPVPVNQEVTVSARVRETVRRSIFVEAMMSAGETVLARGEARMMVLKSAPAQA